MLWRGQVILHWIVIGKQANEYESLVLIAIRRLFGRAITRDDIQILARRRIHLIPL